MDRQAASKLNAGTNVIATIEGGRIVLDGVTTGPMASDGRVPVRFTGAPKNVPGVTLPKTGNVPHNNLTRR